MAKTITEEINAYSNLNVKGKSTFSDDVTLGKNAEVVDENGNERFLSLAIDNQTMSTADKNNYVKIIKTPMMEGDKHAIILRYASPQGIIESNNYGIQITSDYDSYYTGTIFQTWRVIVNGASLTWPTESGYLALTSNIPSLYHHRIMLSVPAGRSFIFDAVTTDNTPIDSLTDLFAKLGNTEYGGCGYVSDNQLSNMIHVGTNSDGTYFLSATGAGTQVTLASSRFTFVSDSVTAISVSPSASAKEGPVWNEEEEEPNTDVEAVPAVAVTQKKSKKDK